MDRINSSQPRSAEAFTDLVRPLLPEFSDHQVNLVLRYRDLLHDRNQRVNLTAVRDFEGIERRLILESLRLVPVIQERAGNGRIMDLGSGGGIPGIVLAIAFPDYEFTLIDATGKKVRFQQEVADELQLSNIRAVQGRAEELAHDIDWRNNFDVVSARAVTSLSALMELSTLR